jgi:putative membrane protein
MMGWYGGGMGMGAWLFMGTFWILLLGAAVWLVARLVFAGDRYGDRDRSGVESPEDILDRRFARGELDEQTYITQRSALAAHRGPG